MAFTVEDGSGLADANAYVAVAEFKGHHDDRGGDYSAFTDTQIQQGIVLATDYVDKRFGRRFRGFRESKAQGLEWPRIDAFDNDDFLLTDVPRQLKKAVSEYALIALNLGRDLAPPVTPNYGVLDPTTGETTQTGSGQVSAKREKVGPIEEETRFSSEQTLQERSRSSLSALVAHIPEYPQADLWLEELITNTLSRDLVRG